METQNQQLLSCVKCGEFLMVQGAPQIPMVWEQSTVKREEGMGWTSAFTLSFQKGQSPSNRQESIRLFGRVVYIAEGECKSSGLLGWKKLHSGI